MYKLFLTLRYLTRKAIVIFPILVVWLCVMMMIIVTSIMGGFVDRVREANRGLMGDVIIESHSGYGFAHYEDLQARLAKLPNVILSTPVVHAYGLVNFPDFHANCPGQILGIDPVARAKISDFQHTLFKQYSVPMQAIEDLHGLTFPADTVAVQRAAMELLDHRQNAWEDARARVTAMFADEKAQLAIQREAVVLFSAGAGFFLLAFLVVLVGTLGWRRGLLTLLYGVLALAAVGMGLQILVFFDFFGQAIQLGLVSGLFVISTLILIFSSAALGRWKTAAVSCLLILATAGCLVWGIVVARTIDRLEDQAAEARRLNAQANYTFRHVTHLDSKLHFANAQELQKALNPKPPTFTPPPEAAENYASPADAPKYGCIVGIDLGLYERDRKGNYDRSPRSDFVKTIVTVVPITARGTPLFTNPQDEAFTVVDDSYTRVFDVDSTYVYAPFEVVQRMTLMAGGEDADGHPLPARCNEIHIKVVNSDDPAALRATTKKINAVLDEFRQSYPDEMNVQNIAAAQTWDQKQAKYINAVKNEKSMLTFILGLMSIVVLVVIFLIFYMIVRDKTRDIGIIKALGGSEEGVAGIFLMYGLFIGTVGGSLGTLCGVIFVQHTNWIHDQVLYGVFGVTIWDRSVYLFDRIPDTVNPKECFLYLLSAILAGGIGALLPAILAGSQDPVKAVRYE